MTCKIPKYIDLNKIDYRPKKINNNRYYLYFKIKNKRKSKMVFIIMKNPSASFKGIHLNQSKDYHNKYLDITTIRAITFSKRSGYTDIFLLNLYTYYDTVARNINLHYGFVQRSNPSDSTIIIDKLRYTKNIQVIDTLYKKYKSMNPDVILACGNSNGIYKGYYYHRVQEIIDFAINNAISLKEVSISKSKCKGVAKNIVCYPKHPQTWAYTDKIF